MGQRRHKRHHLATKSYTLPSSPTHSSSSSEFEFTVSAAPRKSSAVAADADLCPADELFYKGQLLPLHPTTRLSMVRALLLSSASASTSSSSDTTTTRDSTASRSDCGSSSGRPSSAADDLELKRLTAGPRSKPQYTTSKYFSLPKLFRKDHKRHAPPPSPHSVGSAAVKRVSSGAKEMIRRYLKKVKPLYEKLSQKQKTSPPPPPAAAASRITAADDNKEKYGQASILQSFSGNLRLYPVRARSYVSSCPSSMGSSPSHAKSGFGYGFGFPRPGRVGMYNADASSMEELQSAIQGAIAHCKNSMLLNNKAMVSNEV